MARVTDPQRSTGSGAAASPGPDDGSATLLVVIWSAVLVVLGVAALALITALAARTQVAAAADLGALAGATAVLDGETEACRRAGSVVRANGADLVSCHLDGDEVRVEVLLTTARATRWVWPGRLPGLRARAHAALRPGAESVP